MQEAFIAHRPKKRFPLRSVSFLFILIFLLTAKGMPTDAVAAPIVTAGSDKNLTQLLSDTQVYLEVSKNAPVPRVYAKNYLLMDGETGDVLYAEQPDESIAIASTTKMVTALTAMKLLDPQQIVTVSSFSTRIQGSKIDLLSGEKVRVIDLLKALLISSGNDSAFALAEAYSGEVGEYKKFVSEMNRYVTDNGLSNTRFGDPAGLDDEVGRSTPRELAHIARLLLKDKVLAEIIATPKTVITSVDGSLQHELKNTNRLIQSDTSYYLPSSLGGKTGFTHAAGHCLVAVHKVGGRTLIGVVMNTTEYTNTASANEMKKLFLWAEQYIETKTY